MTITSRFPGRCAVCRQTFPAGTSILWSRSDKARHISCPPVVAEAPAAPAPVLSAAPAVAFLRAAQARGLKFPKARFAHKGSTLRLSVAGDRARVPGSVQVHQGGAWVGRIEPSGIIAGPLAFDPETIAALAVIMSDPAKAAASYGALSGACSFCDRALTDDGSVEVGYGPVCAKKFGLPWVRRGVRDVERSAAPIASPASMIDSLLAGLL